MSGPLQRARLNIPLVPSLRQPHPEAPQAEPVALRSHRSRDRFLCSSARFERELLAQGWLAPGPLEAVLAGGAPRGGRGPTSRVLLPQSRVALHLRPLRHGGWLGRLWLDLDFGLARPLRELRVTAELRARGAPVPEPALVAARRVLGPLWQSALGSVEQAGSESALARLRAQPALRERIDLARQAGHSIARFHAAGGRHPDLHLGNLLVSGAAAAPRVLVVDLDRARLAAPGSARRRARELARLYRSALKQRVAPGLDRRTLAAFLGAYCGRDRALRAALRRELPRARAGVALHRIGYGLGRLAGRRAAADRGTS